MTNENGNGSSRLDRLEAIMLDLAHATVRQDNAMHRHDEEFSRINATLERIAEQQREADARYERRFSQNEEAIAILTASIQERRNMVADYGV